MADKGWSQELIELKDHIDSKHLAVMERLGKIQVEQMRLKTELKALPCVRHEEAIKAASALADSAKRWNRALTILAAILGALLAGLGLTRGGRP